MKIQLKTPSEQLGIILMMLLVALCPTTSNAQSNYSWKNVKVVAGGYVPGIVFSRAQKGLAYCRTDIGSFYKWDDAAQRWVPLCDWCGVSNLMGGESVAADPRDANIVYLAAGMGMDEKAAIMRSRDQGKTFETIDVPFVMGGNDDGRSVGERLAIDPNSTNILYFGSRRDGLWKSTDSGSTWKKVDAFPTPVDRRRSSTGLSFVVFDPSSSTDGSPCKTIYVGVATAFEHQLYRSRDAGEHWEPVPGQPSLLAMKAELDSRGILYITYANRSGPNGATSGAVCRLDTKSDAWADITPTPSGFCGISIDHQHPGTLIVSTLDHWQPSDDIYRTTDDGKTWKSIDQKATRDISLSPYLSFGADRAKFGWWISALALDPFDSDHAMYGTGATIYGTHNLTDVERDHPTNWTVAADGMEETAIICLISPSDGAHLISGFGDIGGFVHNDLTVSPPAGMFTNPVFTNTDALIIAPENPRIVVRMGRTDSGKKMALSVDGGARWKPLIPPKSAATQNGKSADPNDNNWEPKGTLVISADGSGMLYSNGVPYYSTDLGGTWNLAKGLPSSSRLVGDGKNGKAFYGIDQSQGRIYVSEDGGATFTGSPSQCQSGETRGARSQIFATPGIAGDLWIASERTLMHSSDGGKLFRPLSKAPAIEGDGRCFGFGKAPPGKAAPTLFASGELDGVTAIYRSDDSGASWLRINDDQHQYGTRFRCLCGDPRIYGRVYVGTDGRGVFYGDINDRPTNP